MWVAILGYLWNYLGHFKAILEHQKKSYHAFRIYLQMLSWSCNYALYVFSHCCYSRVFDDTNTYHCLLPLPSPHCFRIMEMLFNVHKDCWSFSRRELSKREHICWPHVIYAATILEHLKTTNHAFLVLFQTYTDRSYSLAVILICFCALLETFTEHVKHSVPLTLWIIKGADSRTWMSRRNWSTWD